MQKKTTLFLSSAVFVFIALALWFIEADHHHEHEHEHDHDHEPQEIVALSEEQMQTNGIEVQSAKGGILQKVVRAPAKITINPDHLAHIFPKVTGNAWIAYKNLGETIQQGEVLALLESREMAEAKADFLAAQKKERLTAYCYDREKNLFDKRISAEGDYHKAKHDWDEAKIHLELTRQKLHALGLSSFEIKQLPDADPVTLRFYELRAPISGNIIHRHFNPGEFIGLEHEAFIIADLTKVWAEINIFPEDLEYLQKGQILTISMPSGHSTQAKITYISPVIDEDTRTATAIAEINNQSGNWSPGTFTYANLNTDIVEYPLVIPKDAIQKIDDIDTIFIASSEGFRVRPVKIGQSDEQNCEVIFGLEPGEAYACKNTFLLKADLKKEEAEHMD